MMLAVVQYAVHLADRIDRAPAVVAASEDVATVLRRLRIRVVDPAEAADTDVVLKPSTDMTPQAQAAYAALRWLQLTNLPLPPVDVMHLLLPVHPEFNRYYGSPYVNTLALLRVPKLLAWAVASAADEARAFAPTVIVAFETRAMAFGVAVAAALGIAFVPVRKTGHMPGTDLREGVTETRDVGVITDGGAFLRGSIVVVVDDVVRTGRTVAAIANLLTPQHVIVAGCVAVVDIPSEPRPAACPPVKGILTLGL
jgi:adenine phosphoribosyltransferase